MPDIFLSYSRKNMGTAGKLAAAFVAAGHDVWWDQSLKAGEVYDQVTETALREARVVVVLWSKASVASDWVRSEATVALQRGALVPVMIEDCQRPVMFELRQSADLIGWKGNAKDPRLAALVADVTRQLGASQMAAPAAVSAGIGRRQLIGGTAVAAGAAAAGFAGWRQWGGMIAGGGADDGTASVVVLPFANLSGDPAQAFFSDGIAEELRTAMAQIPGLKVIGRVSSEKFRDATDMAEVAGALGVANVVTGSVRRSASTVRISAQLVEGKTGVERWSQSFDRQTGDVLAIQTSIATSVVAALSARLGAKFSAVTVGGTKSPAAQELMLRVAALEPGRNSEADLRERLALVDAAIALDPAYAEAYATKFELLRGLSLVALNTEDYFRLREEGEVAVRRAVALGPNLGTTHSALSRQKIRSLDMRGALAELNQALALSPGDSRVVRRAGGDLSNFDPLRGIAVVRQAIALDPLDPNALGSLAYALVFARRYREALSAIRQAHAMSNGGIGPILLIRALIQNNEFAEARTLLPGVKPEIRYHYTAATLEAVAGNIAGSNAALAALRQGDNGQIDYQFAQIHAVRGETALALAAIEAAWTARDPGLATIAFDAFLDSIRKEPRFRAVQDKVIPSDLIVPLT